MVMYTLDDLRDAQAQENYLLVQRIAAFLMAAYLPREDHLKVSMGYAWSLEQMGAWDQALELYALLETLHTTAKMSGYMVARRARVLAKMGQCEQASGLLDSLAAQITTTITDDDERDWVNNHIRLARAS